MSMRLVCLAVLAAFCPLLHSQVPEVLYFQFNEGGGSTTANHAVPGRGNATLPVTAGQTWLTPGHLGSAAITYNPNGDPLLTGWATDIGAGSWTVEFWMRSVTGSLAMYACGDTTANSWRVFKGGAVNSTLGIRMTGGGLPTADIPNVADGTWHHVAWVYDSTANSVTMYRDGVLSGTLTGQFLNITGTQFIVGNDRIGNNTRNLDGDMDEFRFWSVARTQAEIQGAMNSEIGDPPEMSVEFNNTAVANAGIVNVGNARTQVGETLTFDIYNDAAALGDLRLTGTPAVTLTQGANLAAATGVQSQPGLVLIPPAGDTRFTIHVEPQAPGPFDLVISIPNNDPLKNPFEFTIQGNGVLPNGPAYSAVAAGSVLSSPQPGTYFVALDPGQSLANVTIELLDPDGDPISVTAIDPPSPAPSGIVAPSIPAVPAQPVFLEWTGTADAANDPGPYAWTVHFVDSVNGTPETAEVTISINDLPPAHAIAGADSGSGTPADPYYTTFIQGDGPSVSVDMASVSDPNTGQTLNIVNITPGINPAGGAGFQINLNAGLLSMQPNAPLAAMDAGTHTFTVQIGDGTNLIAVVLQALVYSTSGTIVFDTPNPLPEGTINSPYSVSIQVSNASSPQFSLQIGSLPQGLSISGAGTISGTPLSVGQYNFLVRVLDGIDIATQQYELEIKPAPPPPSGGGGGSSGSGCHATAGGGLGMLALLGLLAWRRRRFA